MIRMRKTGGNTRPTIETYTASPVETGMLPNYLRLHLIKRFGCSKYSCGGWAVLNHAIKVTGNDGSWKDHWGRCEFRGRQTLVSEPYAGVDHFASAKQFAEACDMRLIVDPQSWHYPGVTTRLLFVLAEHDEADRKAWLEARRAERGQQ